MKSLYQRTCRVPETSTSGNGAHDSPAEPPLCTGAGSQFCVVNIPSLHLAGNVQAADLIGDPVLYRSKESSLPNWKFAFSVIVNNMKKEYECFISLEEAFFSVSPTLGNDFGSGITSVEISKEMEGLKAGKDVQDKVPCNHFMLRLIGSDRISEKLSKQMDLFFSSGSMEVCTDCEALDRVKGCDSEDSSCQECIFSVPVDSSLPFSTVAINRNNNKCVTCVFPFYTDPKQIDIAKRKGYSICSISSFPGFVSMYLTTYKNIHDPKKCSQFQPSVSLSPLSDGSIFSVKYGSDKVVNCVVPNSGVTPAEMLNNGVFCQCPKLVYYQMGMEPLFPGEDNNHDSIFGKRACRTWDDMLPENLDLSVLDAHKIPLPTPPCASATNTDNAGENPCRKDDLRFSLALDRSPKSFLETRSLRALASGGELLPKRALQR